MNFIKEDYLCHGMADKIMEKVVLVFDDHDNDAQWTAKIIEDDLGYLCVVYNNVRQCLDEIDAGLKFDLLLTDLAVDGSRDTLTGEDLGQRVRDLYPNLPIVTCSGYDFQPRFSNYHLAKPVPTRGILTVIQSFLE